MPLPRPSLTTIISRAGADIRGQFSGAVSTLRRSVEYGITRAVAGASHLLHGRIDWAVDQAFLVKGKIDPLYVGLAADVWLEGISPAVASTGDVTITGTPTTPVPTGYQIQRSDGFVYAIDSPGGTIPGGGSIDLPATAVVPSADGDAESGVSLTAVSPEAGIDSAATVASGGFTGGADEQTSDEVVDAVLDRIREPPRSGGPGDYVRWALESDVSVARAWQVGRYPTAGQVSVFVLDSSDGSPSGLANVAPYIEARRPETADVIVQAPTVTSVAFTITGLSPDTSTIRAALEAELTDLFTENTRPSGTITTEQMIEAIQRAEGVEAFELTAPAADQTAGATAILKRGTVTYA